jgi:small nuclear ribonucleoprotein (snRNP)-like protein
MFQRHTFFALFLVMAFSMQEAIAQGSEVVILLKTGEEIEGELLSVRDDALVISKDVGAREYDLKASPDEISVIRRDSIKSVTIEGSSYVLTGIGIGFVGGVAVGWAIGSSSKSEDVVEDVLKPATTAISAALGGLVGLGVGAIVGAAVSRSDQEVSVAEPNKILSLRKSARYTKQEPDFLQKIQ